MSTNNLELFCMFSTQDKTELELDNTDGAQLTIDTTTKKYGAASLRYNGSLNTASRKTQFLLNPSGTYNVCFGGWVRVDSSTGLVEFAGFTAGGFARDLGLGFNAGKLFLTDSSGAVKWTAAAAVTTGNWYWVVLHFNGAHGSNARVKYYNTTASGGQNGTLVEDSGWKGVAVSNATMQYLFMGSPGTGHGGALDIYMDGFMVVSAGDEPPICPDFVEFAPTGDSATNNTWTASGGGSKFADVDEYPPDDAARISKATSGIQEFTTSSGSPGGSNVLAVGVRAYTKKVGAGFTSLNIRMRRTSTIARTSFPTTSYTWLSRNWRTLDTEGVGWTIANVDATEFGLGTAVGPTNTPTCDSFVMFAAYGPNRVPVTYGGDEAAVTPDKYNRQMLI